MQQYANTNGDSGVISYQLGIDYIKVQFRSGRWTLYTYTHASAGSSAVSVMKSLAQQGHGLNSYISIHKPGYSSKE